MKKTVYGFFALLGLALGTTTSVQAQDNLGADCGCPSVASRPEINVTSLPGYVAVSGTFGGEMTTGATFTCANTYILDKKIYIPAGQTLTIAPGTVIKGGANAIPSEATALTIERGGRIMANGTESCPIVFTAAADDMDGTYPIGNIGLWGGVVICGKASNNLLLSNNGTYSAGAGNGRLAVADGLGVVEGFATSNKNDRFGVLLSGTVAGETIGTFDDNDNSGVMRYVSIRHTGTFLAVGNEINALTLASVGRGTVIEHVEIVSGADDSIEIFGGTVDLKYCSILFGNDDMYDWDLGWTGRGQFLFGMKTSTSASPDADNGIEGDSDDQASNNSPRSHPKFYNMTLLGNSKTVGTSDNSGLCAIMAKDLTEGEIYNSVFANFRNGFNMVKSISGTRTFAAGGQAWHNWTNNPAVPTLATATTGNGTQSLKVVCNTFVGVTNPLTTGATSAAAGTVITSGADFTQFTTTDKNDIVVGNTLPGFNYNFTVDNTTNNFSVQNDVVPNPALSVSGCPTAPVDGFYTPAPYRGAFSSEAGQNWLSDWSYSAVLNHSTGIAACPTDLDQDGDTDVDDFLIFAPEFGSSCN